MRLDRQREGVVINPEVAAGPAGQTVGRTPRAGGRRSARRNREPCGRAAAGLRARRRNSQPPDQSAGSECCERQEKSFTPPPPPPRTNVRFSMALPNSPNSRGDGPSPLLREMVDRRLGLRQARMGQGWVRGRRGAALVGRRGVDGGGAGMTEGGRRDDGGSAGVAVGRGGDGVGGGVVM